MLVPVHHRLARAGATGQLALGEAGAPPRRSDQVARLHAHSMPHQASPIGDRSASTRRPPSHTLAAMRATVTRIDDALSIREGRLWIEECDAVELARRFGTPVYAVSEDQLRRNARRIHAAFADRWTEGPTRLLPSLKANISLALRTILNAEGLGCDTFGPGELHLAIAAAKTTARKARVRLRLRPDYEGLDHPSDFAPDVAVRVAAHRYKPGIPLEQAADVAKRALAALDQIELLGVMAHLGRHSADPAVWRAMAASPAPAIDRLCAQLDGWR